MSTPTVAPGVARAWIAQAMRAPSSHNTQPWRFRIHSAGIDLCADRLRALPVNDPDDRELTISCGAALFNLRVAAAHAGQATTVQRNSVHAKEGDADRLATLAWSGGTPEAGVAALFDAIARRCTWRRRFDDERVAIGADTIAALVDAARDEGVWLQVLDERQRAAAAALVAEGDALQWADPHWRRELALWMHPRRRGDGLGLPALAVPLAQAVVRSFDMGHGVAARDRELADASPLLAVLGTLRDEVSDWLAAGQGLQRVLLTACGLDLQASYLNQPVQLAALRPRMQQQLRRDGAPQLLLRLGPVSNAAAPSPRRALDDVIEAA